MGDGPLNRQQDFSERSYLAHEAGYAQYAQGAGKDRHARSWLDAGSINTWRFNRMYCVADPLLEGFPGARWLTVGDGRYGMDAMYLKTRGARVLATDISDTLLVEARAQGLIDEYAKENAEALSFADASFDFVFCKESYHHFPRPMKALYEMLRVARKGVVLVEPNDPLNIQSAIGMISRAAKNAIKRALGRRTDAHDFEELGNYVFTISRREMVKVALGMDLRLVATKGINDHYLPGVEFEAARADSLLFRRIRRRIAWYDLLCRLGISQYGLLGVILLREPPAAPVVEALRRHGLAVVDLPRNPYAK